MPPSSVARMNSMPRTVSCAALSRSCTIPGLPSAPLSEWTWQSIRPGISVAPEVSTVSPAKPANSGVGATFRILPPSSRTAWPSSTFSPSNRRPPAYNVAMKSPVLRGALSSGGTLPATQRIGRDLAAGFHLLPLDLGVDSHDVRIPLPGQLEGGGGARVLAHLRPDHAEARVGAEM